MRIMSYNVNNDAFWDKYDYTGVDVWIYYTGITSNVAYFVGETQSKCCIILNCFRYIRFVFD